MNQTLFEICDIIFPARRVLDRGCFEFHSQGADPLYYLYHEWVGGGELRIVWACVALAHDFASQEPIDTTTTFTRCMVHEEFGRVGGYYGQPLTLHELQRRIPLGSYAIPQVRGRGTQLRPFYLTGMHRLPQKD